MSSLSIIIATCNRENTLKKALRAYAQQSASGEISEILVVDDGFTDSMQDMVANYAKSARRALITGITGQDGSHEHDLDGLGLEQP